MWLTHRKTTIWPIRLTDWSVGVKNVRKYRLNNTRRENPENLHFLHYLLQTAEGGSSEVKCRQMRVFYGTPVSPFFTQLFRSWNLKWWWNDVHRRYTSFYHHFKLYPGPQFANRIQRRNYIKEYAKPRQLKDTKFIKNVNTNSVYNTRGLKFNKNLYM